MNALSSWLLALMVRNIALTCVCANRLSRSTRRNAEFGGPEHITIPFHREVKAQRRCMIPGVVTLSLYSNYHACPYLCTD